MSSPSGAQPPKTSQPASTTPVMASVGNHRLVRSLGKGGLGEVFEALAPDGTRVALKVFRLRDDEQGLLATAFVREATLGQRLDHPDIVKVLASGTDGEHVYLVMEFVDGVDLRAHTRPDRLLPLASALQVTERVCGALAAAHALHVIHRDVKPANVLVNLPRVVKLSDFGLARLGDAFLSRTGLIAGTPGYMSPEQLADVEATPRSDLFSLGVLLFELLTARLPYEASSMGALLQQVANRPAPPVSVHRPGLPPALVQLIAELLRKDPAFRPPSAAAVAERLRMVLAGLPSPGPGPMSQS